MKLPANGKWAVDQSSDRGLALYATKNISFDSEGYATLSNRTIAAFNEGDDSSFRVPIAIFQNPAAVKEVGTGGQPYTINLNSLPYSIAVDGLTNQPTGNNNSSQAYFNNKWTVSTNTGFRYYDGSAWTDPSASLTSGVRHPLCSHRGNNSLLVGNGAQVKQFNTSYSETTNLTLPAGIEVVGIAYNRNFAAIITWDANGHEAGFYIWDGATAAANYYYPLGSNRAWFVAGYKDTFITINGLGQILKWDTTGLTMIGALPAYFTTAIFSDIDDRIDIAHDTSIYVDGERILFNVMTVMASKNSEANEYLPTQPSGLYCWDPAVGFYHRHCPSGAKMSSQTIVAGSINTGTDVITATAAPATGTPFLYSSISGTATDSIVPLAENTIYYVINTGATTFKVAATRALAAAGTAIDLTSAPSSFSYGFLFFPESDFGQQAVDGYAGIITNTGPQENNSSKNFFTVFQKYLFGFLDVCRNATSDAVDALEIVMDRSENRGWLMTQWLFSPNVRETFEKLYVKARNLLTENDKILLKFRIGEAAGFPIICRSFDKVATWTVFTATSSTFTTAANLAALKAAFDADATFGAYEIEIIAGAGSGYLAHITAIALNAGTYTVVIDEPIRNCSVSDTFYFIADNWIRLQDKNGNAAITSASDPDYSEFPIAGKSKKVQFKIELRGFRIQLEELEIVNTGDKPAA